MSDLHSLIARALDESPIADPNVIAREIATQLPDAELRSALEVVLPGYVITAATRHRNAVLGSVPHVGDAVGSRRWQVAASVLSARVHTGSEWKLLRNCTRDDLLGAAEQRRSLAAGIEKQAERFEALATLMLQRGAAVAADLGENQIREVMAA